MALLFANRGTPDQMPRSAASNLGLHCLLIILLGVSRLQWGNSETAPNYKHIFRSYSYSGNKIGKEIF